MIMYVDLQKNKKKGSESQDLKWNIFHIFQLAFLMLQKKICILRAQIKDKYSKNTIPKSNIAMSLFQLG